ncbi:glycoside hydrolase family 38 C-terminal domain-containing protein [Streptomyces sp. NPDC057543]|uniref:glycoside hydrolase family 38 C-terminal domain-containing protein n=1 Tax=Streptomyces sp. NPDC057543 TaxID=3346163 RepID=UPI003674FE26
MSCGCLLDGSAIPEHAVTSTGYATESADGSATGPAREGFVRANGLLRVVVDGDGLISAVRDLDAERDVLAPGHRANVLQLHPDHSNRLDAWDIGRRHRRTRTDLTDADSVELVEEGRCGPLSG